MPVLRSLAIVILFAAAIGAAAGPVQARGRPEVYAVSAVTVDITANSAAAAKDKALAEGQRAAFERLLKRMTVAADHDRLPEITADLAQQYVRDFAIESEKASSVRYIASLTVRFNAPAVRRLLETAGLAYAEVRSRPVLVLPVFQRDADSPVLWGDDNPWFEAWAGRDHHGLVPVVLPLGDLADLRAVDARRALAAAPEDLAALGQRYGTPDVMVAAAMLATDGEGRPVRLDVAVIPAGAGVPVPAVAGGFRAAPGETATDLLARAVADLARGMDESYKQDNLLRFDRAATLAALVPVGGFEDWLAVRERVSAVPLVRRYEVLSLSPREAALNLHYIGDQDQLRAALAEAGLAMDWGGGYWVLRPAGSTRPN